MKSGKSPTYFFGRGIVFHLYYQKIEKWNGKLPKVTGGNAIVSLYGDEEAAGAADSENSEK